MFARNDTLLTMRCLKLVTALVVAQLLFGCATPKRDDYAQYFASDQTVDLSDKALVVALKQDVQVRFRGAYDSNNDTGQGVVMYEGSAGTEGLILQLMAHAAISSNMQNSKLSQQQIRANKVLLPLQDVLQEFRQNALIHDANGYQFAGDSIDEGIKLESRPIFFLSQDLNSISLKHFVKAYQPDQEQVLYQNMIEVISPTINVKEPYKALNKNRGELLMTMAKNLYKSSLSLAVADINGEYKNKAAPQKSFRIEQGDQVRVERGVSIDQQQDQAIIRNLRGWLVAFPNGNGKDKTDG